MQLKKTSLRPYPTIDKLNEHQKVIYEILEKNRRMPACSLYGEYRPLTRAPVVDRAYRNYMQKMVKLGLIKSDGKGRWKSYEIAC
ncbi:MAG: hypothetical protein NWE95_11750 [Candidatus Bathyarchaeota archaeon]|nr:hypothetical protein [Candidatus Bathyarchaeota archaeon]